MFIFNLRSLKAKKRLHILWTKFFKFINRSLGIYSSKFNEHMSSATNLGSTYANLLCYSSFIWNPHSTCIFFHDNNYGCCFCVFFLLLRCRLTGKKGFNNTFQLRFILVVKADLRLFKIPVRGFECPKENEVIIRLG